MFASGLVALLDAGGEVILFLDRQKRGLPNLFEIKLVSGVAVVGLTNLFDRDRLDDLFFGQSFRAWLLVLCAFGVSVLGHLHYIAMRHRSVRLAILRLRSGNRDASQTLLLRALLFLQGGENSGFAGQGRLSHRTREMDADHFGVDDAHREQSRTLRHLRGRHPCGCGLASYGRFLQFQFHICGLTECFDRH